MECKTLKNNVPKRNFYSRESHFSLRQDVSSNRFAARYDKVQEGDMIYVISARNRIIGGYTYEIASLIE